MREEATVTTNAACPELFESEVMHNNVCTFADSNTKENKKSAAEIVPFTDGFDYLDAWFGALGAPIVLDAGAGTQQQAGSSETVYGRLPGLLRRTLESVEAGVELPFEEFASKHGLDLVDRLILLALLRDAHDPRSGVGLSQASVFLAVEATTLSRRIGVMSRLDERGALRDLKLVECLPGWTRDERRYRLAERFVGPVTRGTGDVMGFPRLSPDPIEAFQALAADVKLLGAAIKMGCLDEYKVWGGAREKEPGWDSTEPWRAMLEARLEASARLESDRIGAEIRRIGLEGDERLAWAVLLADADEEVVGVKVPRVVQVTGRHADPERAAERLLGPDSKLGKADCIRFNRADGPVLGRIAWLSREARGRVIPWPRGAFFIKPGVDLEALPFTPRVGFDPYGNQKQDRIAAKGVSR